MTPEGQALLAELWRRGEAWRVLGDVGLETGGQREWIAALNSSPAQSANVWMISRQRGKSWAALLYACCVAVRTPGAIIRYAAQTGKSAKAIIEPTMAQLLETMPEEVRPTPNSERGLYEWPNGSVLVWAGTDNEQFERLRGPRAHLILLDESAFYADLERVESALLPQLTTTGGRVLYLSSPPETPAHPFVARYRAAQAHGRARHATLHDNPRLGPEGVTRIARAEAERLGVTRDELEASTYWQREFLARVVTEASRAVVPAWTEARAASLVVEAPRPALFDAYVGADWGVRPDPKATLFAWHSPAEGLYVEEELEARDCTISEWVGQTKAIESRLWGTSRYDGTLFGLDEWVKTLREVPPFLERSMRKVAPRQPYLRVGDDDSEVLLELAVTHGYTVVPTRKHDKHLSVDALNQLFVSGRIRIHPRCVRLREQLFSTLWNRHRTDWERTARDHGDLVACFVEGTTIATEHGPMPIESVTAGTKVWTRAGLKTAFIASRTCRDAEIWRLTLESGTVLEGTAEHPILTPDGWTQLRLLAPSSIVFEWTQPRRSLSGVVDDGLATQRPSAANIASTSFTLSGGRKPTFIERCGRALTDLFRGGTSSTIATGTHSTTTSGTSNVSPRASTCDSTCWSPRGGWQLPSSNRSAKSAQGCGTPLQRGESSTPSTPSTPRGFGAIRLLLTVAELCVARCLAPRRSGQLSAAPTATVRSDTSQASTTSRGHAPGAEAPSPSTGTTQPATVPVRVASVVATGRRASVYNLSVAEQPEYFANGVLVHNCLVYLCRNVAWHRPATPVVDDWAPMRVDSGPLRRTLGESLSRRRGP